MNKKKVKFSLLCATICAVMLFNIIACTALDYYGEEYSNQPSASYTQKFDDVKKSHWAFDYIMEMNSRGVLSGYPNGYFYPENPVTRAEFAKIMCLASGLTVTAVTSTSYDDVDTDDWFAPYVESGKYYLSGYVSNGQKFYMPNSNALREDIAVALVKLKGYDTSVYDESILKAMFTDWQSISEGARKYVTVAVERGLISGFEDNTFRGQATLTRAEAATLLWRAYQFGNDNKVFEKEELEIPAQKEEKTQHTEKEEKPKPTEPEKKKLSLSLKVSDSSITVEEGESVSFDVTVNSEVEGRYVPSVSGDTKILSSCDPDVTTTGYKTICAYKTNSLSEGEYNLTFNISDDTKEHSKAVKIKVKKAQPLSLSLTASKSSYTVEDGESVNFKITVNSNTEGEYIPEVSGDTNILSGSPHVSTKGYNTICEYETEELETGKYELNFSIKDETQTHRQTIKITAKEPEPEYTYEMDTLIEDIGDIFQLVTTKNGFAYSVKSEDRNENGNFIYTIYEFDESSQSTTPVFCTEDVPYLGTEELTKAEQAKLHAEIHGIGFNQNDNCIYAILAQSYRYYIYNITENCVEREIYYKPNSEANGGEVAFLRNYFKITFDVDNNLFIEAKLMLEDTFTAFSISRPCFVLENTLCSFENSGFIYYDIRTGNWKDIDYYIDKSGNFVCANNRYAFYVTSNDVYTVDVNGDSELAFTFNDIDNVDRKIITLSNINLRKSSANDEGTIYFYDAKYDAIRCIRKK